MGGIGGDCLVVVALAYGMEQGISMMPRLSIEQLERRCQKPDHRRVGNCMARRVTRPLALRVTWLVLPWRLSAHAATAAAWIAGLGASAMFGVGTPGAWLAGAVLLQLWYLLDHVDGQLARYHGTASLDGVQLDYLMHHTINLLVPVGLGWGVHRATGPDVWIVAGLAWGVGLLMIGLVNDTRYKAFVQRLKRVRGELRVVGGGGARPAPPARPTGSIASRVAWLSRKACEMHAVMNVLAVLALASWIAGDASLLAGRVYAAAMALLAIVVAVASTTRSVRRGTAEAEFAAWYRPDDGCRVAFESGWWNVRTDPPEPTGVAERMTAAGDQRSY